MSSLDKEIESNYPAPWPCNFFWVIECLQVLKKLSPKKHLCGWAALSLALLPEPKSMLRLWC